MTISTKSLVQVNPSVLAAGGQAASMNGLCLTNTTSRVPIGTILSFASALAVSTFFGPASVEASLANNYFGGYVGQSAQPSAMNFAQYPTANVAAFLRGGVANPSLSSIQAVQPSVVTASIGGSVTATVGWTGTGTAAANLMTISASSGLVSIGDLVSGSGVTPGTFIVNQVSGTVGGNGVYTLSQNATSSANPLVGSSTVINVTAVSSGTIQSGDQVSGTIAFTTASVLAQLSGTVGGVGTYRLSTPFQAVSQTVTDLSTTMNVTSAGATALIPGMLLSGSNVTVNSRIVAQLTGPAGGIGNYSVSLQSTTVSESITGAYDLSVTINGGVATASSVNLSTATSFSNAAALIQTALSSGTVSYDSITGTFLISSTTTGTASTISYGSGALATVLGLTQLTGGTLSQGAAAATPSAFMTTLQGISQNYASFFTSFDPDFGAGNAQKLAFATWNAQQNNKYVYLAWDTDPTPAASSSAPNSIGGLLVTNNLSGTLPLWEPSEGGAPNYNSSYNLAATVSGMIAAINFGQVNGRITFAFRSQAGFVPTVTDTTKAANLIANGYNFYGAYGLGSGQWSFVQSGSIGGTFKWADSYVNQIFMNSKFAGDLITLMQNQPSLPFNPQGYGLINSALANDIQAMVDFGAIRSGVTLSASQIQSVNAAFQAAGGIGTIDTTLSTRGWYLQVIPATPSIRAARGPVTVNFWYMDGGSVQSINLSSVLVQ